MLLFGTYDWKNIVGANRGPTGNISLIMMNAAGLCNNHRIIRNTGGPVVDVSENELSYH